MKKIFSFRSVPVVASTIAAALVVVAGCSSAPPDDAASSSQSVVFGDDERAPVTDARVLDAVGVVRGGHGTCTAFAIASDRVATALHCLEGATGALSFTSGAGAASRVVEVARVKRALDYAELRVDRTFAAPFAVEDAHASDHVRVVGLDAASGAIVVSGRCNLGATIDRRSGLATHLCDTVPGASGGPVLRGGSVVAMHLGFAAAREANVALVLSSLDDADASLANDGATIAQETTCATDCSSACEVSYNYPCPTWKKPGRTCRGHTLDPACKARCEVEREVDCNFGVNACDIWATIPAWVEAREALHAYAADGLTAAKCVDIVQLGGTAAGAAGAAYTAYVEGIKALLDVNPLAIAISKGAQHGAECACRKALP